VIGRCRGRGTHCLSGAATRSGIFHDIKLAIQGRSPSHLTQAWPQILPQQIRCCGANQGVMKLELLAGGMANLSIAAGVVCIGF